MATAPLLDGIGGRYFAGRHEAGAHVPGTQTGVAACALDPEAAAHLWQVSITTLVGYLRARLWIPWADSDWATDAGRA